MQLTIRMPDQYKDKLNMLAEKMGLKKSDLIRIALKQFIEENLTLDQRRPFEKVSDLLGTAQSNVHDLGQRHRDYLKKKIGKVS